MLMPQNYPRANKSPIYTPPSKATGFSVSRHRDLKIHSQSIDPIYFMDSTKKPFLRPIPEYQKPPSMTPTYSPKEMAVMEKSYKMYYQRSLSPIKEELMQKPGLSRDTQRISLDRSVGKSSNQEEMMLIEKLKKNKSGFAKKTMKKPKLFNEKHLDFLPVDEARKKKVNFAQIKDFGEKYNLKFTVGYGSKLLEKCIHLLTAENDPFILENVFPGHYTMYTTVISHSVALGEDMKGIQAKYDTLDAPSPNNGFLPAISSKRQLLNSDVSSKSATLGDRDVSSRSTTQDSKFSAGANVFGSKKWRALPRMELDAFKESLHFYKDFVHKSSLFLIEASYKETSLDLGFCEIVWDENKSNSIHISKYFVQKVYRKMGMFVPITVRVLDYMFKTYKLERMTFDWLITNEAMQEPLTSIGFKFERVINKNGQKWQLFVLKRKAFYHFFQEIFSSDDNNLSNILLNKISSDRF